MLVTNSSQLDAPRLNEMLAKTTDECTMLRKSIHKLNAKIHRLEKENSQSTHKTVLLDKQADMIESFDKTLNTAMKYTKKLEEQAALHDKHIALKDAELQRMRDTVRKVHANVIAGRLPLEGF